MSEPANTEDPMSSNILHALYDDEADPKELYEAADVLYFLSRYCLCKARAKTLRLEGKIDDALMHERRAETNYNSLPDWAKW